MFVSVHGHPIVQQGDEDYQRAVKNFFILNGPKQSSFVDFPPFLSTMTTIVQNLKMEKAWGFEPGTAGW